MALSLPGERSRTAATPANPLLAVARWIAQAQAAHARRVALQALLDFDATRLGDLGISRDDVALALTTPGQSGRVLSAARARRACA